MMKKPCLPMAVFLLIMLPYDLLSAQPAKSESGIVYRSRSGVELKMDIAIPETGSGPWPAVVLIFGGGFASGNRQNWMYALSGVTKKGYVAVTIDYSLTSARSPDYKPLFVFPAQVHDVKSAIRWLRKNSAKFGVDPEHIAAVGFSSGGNLALLLGMTADTDLAESDAAGGPSARVQAVVNLAGCTDLVAHHAIHPYYMEPYLGGARASDPARYRAASPVAWASADDSPVLTVVGDKDPALPQEQALDSVLRKAGVPHTLITLPGIGHSQIHLWPSTAQEEVWVFLAKYLKPGG